MIATETIPPGATLHGTTFYCQPNGWFMHSPEMPFIYIPRAVNRRFFRNLASTTATPETNRNLRGVASKQMLGDCKPFQHGDMVYLTQTEVLFKDHDYPLDFILETDNINLLVREPLEDDRLLIGNIFNDEELESDVYSRSGIQFPVNTAVKVIFIDPMTVSRSAKP